MFLRRIVPGGADRSYGIHVAQLAGLPRPVIHRAEEILEELEQEARAPGSTRRTIEVAPAAPLCHHAIPSSRNCKTLDVSAMTPLEAISKLYELQKAGRDELDQSGDGRTKAVCQESRELCLRFDQRELWYDSVQGFHKAELGSKEESMA